MTELVTRIEQLADQAAAARVAFERRQNRRRLAFIAFVLLFVWAQSFAGRVYIRDELLHGCVRAQRAYHALRIAHNYVDCGHSYPAPKPWP